MTLTKLTADKGLTSCFRHGLSLNSLVFFLTGLIIFLNPFPHLTGLTNIISGLIFLLLVYMFYCKTINLKWETPFLIPFACYVIISVVSTVFALDKAESFGDIFSHLLRYIALFYIIINYFNTKIRFRYLLQIIIVSGLIFSIFSLFYFYIIQGHSLTTRFGTGFTDSAICSMGIILVFTFILSLVEIYQTQNRTVKYLLIIGLAFPLSASLLTQSKGTILSIIASMMVIALFKKGKRAIFFAILFCVVIFSCLYSPIQNRIKDSRTFNIRIGLYLYSIEIIKYYPIVGTGFSLDTFRNPNLIDKHKYKKRIPKKYRSEPKFWWPHNMFLSIGVRTGILGLTIYCLLLISFIRLAVRLIRHGKDSFIQINAVYVLSSFTMFCTIGLFTPVFYHLFDFTFFTIFAMLSILWSINKKNPEKKIKKDGKTMKQLSEKRYE